MRFLPFEPFSFPTSQKGQSGANVQHVAVLVSGKSIWENLFSSRKANSFHPRASCFCESINLVSCKSNTSAWGLCTTCLKTVCQELPFAVSMAHSP